MQETLPKPYLTRAILAANIAIFILMAIFSQGQAILSPTGEFLLAVGADYGPLALSSEPWRLVSSMFIHIGLIHIMMNMYVLQDICTVIELFYGSQKLLIIYLIAGIGGSLISLYANPIGISAGASGAVFGAYGALLAFFQAHRQQFTSNFIEKRSQTIIAFIIYNLAFGALSKHIDNACHIGGLIFGYLAGHCVMPKKLCEFQFRFLDLIRLFILASLMIVLYFLDVERLPLK
jgi:rhomboid protease GluP